MRSELEMAQFCLHRIFCVFLCFDIFCKKRVDEGYIIYYNNIRYQKKL